MRCPTLTLTLALLSVTRVAGQHAAAPGDSDTGPVIHGRAFSTGTREGWTFSTPHELTPFVQIGRALVSGNHTEFLIGIARPLAPYKLHFP